MHLLLTLQPGRNSVSPVYESPAELIKENQFIVSYEEQAWSPFLLTKVEIHYATILLYQLSEKKIKSHIDMDIPRKNVDI
ncbi:hypothetical protein STEG23_033138 [Scotinomys teguina]